MNNEKKFIPVMLTPFKKDGSIDFEALTALTNYYLNSGAKGLFANCQSSEMFDLTPGERLGIIEHVMKITDNRVPVVAAGNFGDTVRQQAGFIKQVYDTGVNAVIVFTGLLAGEKEEDNILEHRINELLSLTEGVPLGFYECPLPYKRILPPQLLEQLVQTGRIVYHKDTCLNIAQVKEKNRLCAGVNGFGLYDAYMVHAVESLGAGSAGLSCIQGNYFPELVVWLCNNYNNPALQEQVLLVQQFFIDEMEVMHRHYPQSAKYFLQQAGLPLTTYVRNKSGSEVPELVKKEMGDLILRYRRIAQMLI